MRAGLKIRRYFNAQIEEISSDAAVRFYGACLAFCQVLTFFKWRRQVSHLSNETEPFCWPFFEDCFKYRFFDRSEATEILWIYGAMSVVGVLWFLSRRRVAVAYWWLLAVNLFKTALYAQDYSLRMNQHYMLYWATIAYLFLPNKRQLLRYTLVAFYVGASILKYNKEWITGGALHTNPLFVPDALIPASCVYVVILESFIVWGVLSGNRRIYWISLCQLFWFHVVSWPTVGFFYPMIMFALLAIFPLTALLPHANEPKSLLQSLFRGRQPRSTYAFLGLFALLQLIPIAMPGDEKITGEGRLFSLHMFDAWVTCEGAITLKYADGRTEELPIPMKRRAAIRIKCDPVINFSRAKRSCYEHRDDPNFLDLDLYYEARRSHQPHMRPLVDIKDFCSQKLSYDLWRPNEWIRK